MKEKFIYELQEEGISKWKNIYKFLVTFTIKKVHTSQQIKVRHVLYLVITSIMHYSA